MYYSRTYILEDPRGWSRAWRVNVLRRWWQDPSYRTLRGDPGWLRGSNSRRWIGTGSQGLTRGLPPSPIEMGLPLLPYSFEWGFSLLECASLPYSFFNNPRLQSLRIHACKHKRVKSKRIWGMIMTLPNSLLYIGIDASFNAQSSSRMILWFPKQLTKYPPTRAINLEWCFVSQCINIWKLPISPRWQ